ncbi:maltoporin [Sorangium cellulosum]|uniref:Maltoporin n=1 Tax=Sorangium cellulosum TaxID=56 RepID=A0A150PAY3_SORCE|nr:maltoporin [Sorangium cellulosum]
MTSLKTDRSSVPSKRIAGRRTVVRALGLVAASAICLTAAPRSAHAVGSENFEWHWYSRLGMAWSVYGQNIQGASMNLLGFGIGGRYEEDDYSEPSFVAHVVKGATPDDFFVKSEMTFAIWRQYGGVFMQPSSNGGQSITVQFNQAYIEAGNFLTPGLSVWGGARFFREQYAPIGDYFYLDDLSGQGGGLKYENLNLAILGYRGFGATSPAYNIDINGDGGVDVERFRTIFAGNYKFEFGGEAKHHVKVHAEAHVLQAGKRGPDIPTPDNGKGDFGGVIGAKLHLGLGQGNWSDTSVRFGTGIANGSAGGAKTYQTWGAPNDEGTYQGSFAIEAVEHLGFRIGDVAALEGLATFHYTKAAYEAPAGTTPTAAGPHEKQMDFSVQANATIFAHKNFHPVVEASFQGRKDGEADLGTAVKVSVVPTLVPTGELSAGARPHFKLIYTAAFYNDAAREQALSAYLQRTGAGSNVGHYIGARTDWYF